MVSNQPQLRCCTLEAGNENTGCLSRSCAALSPRRVPEDCLQQILLGAVAPSAFFLQTNCAGQDGRKSMFFS
eukprot:Skav215854  [mRNA]  locus=scaffold1630:262448:263281:+ [translate_table: standard]